MSLSVVGVSHKTAPLEVRERLAFAPAELGPALAALRRLDDVAECALLSTCNRTELYLAAPGDVPTSSVAEALGHLRGVPASDILPWFSIRADDVAARHALRVAAGLESMVVGEQQILGQVRRAFEAAQQAGATGPILNRLMQLAIVTGRRVRRETELSRHASSVPHAALTVCRQTWGAVRGRRVLLVGAGEMAELGAKTFATAGAHVVAVANRTAQTARLVAERVGADVIPLEAIRSVAAEVDAVIVTIGAASPVVHAEALATAGMRATPLLVIDIGVPRGVDPGTASHPGVILYNLDDLAAAGAIHGISEEDLWRAEQIVEAELAVFRRWLASRAAAPVISALHRRVFRIVDEELARARPRLRGLDDRQLDAVRGIMESTLRKILHAPIVKLRDLAAGDDAQVLALVQELFDLNGEPGAPEHSDD